MKISAQEEYGLRCMIAIASSKKDNGLSIPEISKMERLSEPHVAKILSILRKTGYIKSIRGQGGGYILARSPEAILISDLLSSLGGRVFTPEFCDRFNGHTEECVHKGVCPINILWEKIQIAIDRALHGITLSDIIKGLNNAGDKNSNQKHLFMQNIANAQVKR